MDNKQLEKALLEYKGNDKIISSFDMRDYIRERDKDKKIAFIKSGIPSLDKYIKAFEGGELCVISGETGNGKTLFAQTLTENFHKNGFLSVWFTYEVQPDQFLRQFDENLPLFYLPQLLSGNSMGWIKTRIHESKIKYDIKCVFIDHLHYLIDMNDRGNMSLEIGIVMRALKKIALEFDIAVFILAHTAKTRKDSPNELDNSDIRDSSFVSQESDNVFMVWRRNNSDNESVLKITKNRRYGVMNKKINLIKIGKYLQEINYGADGETPAS